MGDGPHASRLCRKAVSPAFHLTRHTPDSEIRIWALLNLCCFLVSVFPLKTLFVLHTWAMAKKGVVHFDGTLFGLFQKERRTTHARYRDTPYIE